MRSGDIVGGRFVLRRPVGRGRREADVWLAVDRNTDDMEVVLKPVPPAGVPAETRALRELRGHANVVTFYDAEPREDPQWLVMEYLPGGSLDHLTGRYRPRDAAAVGARIAEVLVALHAKGYVHCDIKPHNIGLTGYGQPKLLDFGSAYPVGDGGDATVVPDESEAAGGPGPVARYTPDYAAPELAHQRPQRASDVFCLGATLHALVTGHPPRPWCSGGREDAARPLTAAETDQRRAQVRDGVTTLGRGLGPLHRVVKAMLRPDPRDRPTAAQVQAALERVANGSRGVSRSVAVAAAAATAVVVAGAVALPLSQDGSDEPPPARVLKVATTRDLSRALETAAPGDTIRLAPGRYLGVFFTRRQGTEDRPITLTGPSDAVLVNPGGDGKCSPSDDPSVEPYCGYGLHLNHAAHWRLEGFTVAESKKGIVLDDSHHVTIDGVRVHTIEEEGVHLRTSSSDNVVRNSEISFTGLQKPGYGEGIVIGSANSLWPDYGEGGGPDGPLPDRSDRNRVVDNAFGPNISAEHIDIKEGTEGGVVRGNTFDGHGMSGENYADSWVDVKGRNYLVEGNTGVFGGDGVFHDGFQVHTVWPGYGCGNVFRDNDADLGDAAGYAILIDKDVTCEGTAAGPNVVHADNTSTHAGSGLSNVAVTD